MSKCFCYVKATATENFTKACKELTVLLNICTLVTAVHSCSYSINSQELFIQYFLELENNFFLLFIYLQT